ncbi:MAG: TonB-dependent receptor [Dysgonamonadaceae bacterium]|jgi:TonB-linked SusC/RagA family outer membrane protein|nr:TonB-dependent receptor [Dysgonamonadaceae bacterium]
MNCKTINSGQSLPHMIRVAILTFSFLCLFAGKGNAADIPVKGKVTDAAGESMIGVTVMVKGTSTGVATDLDGNYEISVPDRSAVLYFTYIGYVTIEEPVGNRTVINVQLREDNQMLDELVVVGYDTQRKVNLTGAVATVNVAKQLEGRPITDVGRGLQGAAAGLTITTTSGQLGSSPEIRIRGAYGSLLNNANGASRPLILVDNVEIDNLNYVNPDDIESISILKDAASASIYGAKAAFGVVLITTKSGEGVDHFKVSYTNNFAWTSPTVTPKMAKAYESAAMALEARQRRAPGTMEFTSTSNMKWNAETIERMKEWNRVFGGMNLGPEMVLGRDFELINGDPYFYRQWDAAGEYIQDGFTQQHNFSATGKAGKTGYHFGLGYMGDRGILKIKSDHWNRYSASFNTETEVKQWLKLRSKLMFSRTILEQPFSYTSTTYNALYYLYRWPSNYPYGTYQGLPFRSSVAETEQANMNTNRNDYARITLGGTAKFTKNLSLDIDYNFTTYNGLYQLRGGQVTAWDFWNGGMKQVITSGTSSNTYNQQNFSTDYHSTNIIFRYKKDFSEAHKLSAFAGSNIESGYYNMMNGWIYDLLDFSKPSFNTAIGDQFVRGDQTHFARIGYFARANYSFKDRYLVELNGRYDGSTDFPLSQQWGFFPSGSIGWILSEESFMQATQSWLSFAKIRGSFGIIGNPNIGQYQFLPIITYKANSNWIINDVNESTFTMPRALYKGFTWENIETRDLGLDLRFLNSKLGATFDVYQRINSGMVVTGAEVPSTFGTTAPYMNMAEMTTGGWELSLDFNHAFSKDFKIRLNANLSDAVTKLTKHPNTTKSLNFDSTPYYEGQRLGDIWGFETDRYFTEDDFNADGSLKTGIPDQSRYVANAYGFSRLLPGDIKYKDLDGNGVIDRGEFTVDNHGDLKIIGNSTPRYEYSGRIGIDFKGFDLDVFIQGVGSRQMWATGNLVIPGWFAQEGVYYANQTDYWTPENPNAFYPRLAENAQPGRYGEASGNFMPQTKYLLDLSYCRLKNVTFGYSLPKSLLNKASIDKTRIYVSLENLFELDHLGDIPIDPETNTSSGDGGAMGFGRIYPYVRTISFGLQVTL